jgi:hypothetical protein
VRAWIEAGKAIAQDASAKVPCPVCRSATLEIRDEVSSSDSSLRERHMSCPNCGATNSIRLRT